MIVGEFAGDQRNALDEFLTEIERLAGIPDALAGRRNRSFIVNRDVLRLRSKPSLDQNSFFHLRTTIFVPRPGSVSILKSSTSLFVPDRPRPSDFDVLK